MTGIYPYDLLSSYCGVCGLWTHFGTTEHHDFVSRYLNPKFCQSCWVAHENKPYPYCDKQENHHG